jgi:acyl-CoA thioesterase I
MSLIVFLYASGWAFFVGAAMLIAAAFVSTTRFHRATLLTLVGLVVFVAPASTPFPLVCWIALGLAAAYWWPSRNRRHLRRSLFVALWTAAFAFELMQQRSPSLQINREPSIVIAVVGDSMTSGLSETKAIIWPKTLAKRNGVAVVHDFAVEGATCRKAMAQAEKVPDDVDVVIVAIGGNDLLGQTTLDEFERDYDALLKRLWRPNRILIGFELPLPPFHNGWGLAQRRIARKHGVGLIPKWRLMWLLSDPKNTVDSIHPTQAGHDAIERLVWSVLADQ